MRHGTITENKYRKRGEKKPSALGKGKAFHKNCYRVKSLPWFQFHLFATNESAAAPDRTAGGSAALNSLRPGPARPRRGGSRRGWPAVRAERRRQAEAEKALNSPPLSPPFVSSPPLRATYAAERPAASCELSVSFSMEMRGSRSCAAAAVRQ